MSLSKNASDSGSFFVRYLVPFLDLRGAEQEEEDVSDDGDDCHEEEESSPDILLVQYAEHDGAVSEGDQRTRHLAEQSFQSQQSSNIFIVLL